MLMNHVVYQEGENQELKNELKGRQSKDQKGKKSKFERGDVIKWKLKLRRSNYSEKEKY